MTSPHRILLGKIATAHGVRGLVKLYIYSDDPLSLNDYPHFFPRADGGEPLKLRVKTMIGKSWVGEVEGIRDRDAAEKLRGTELWLDRDALPTTGAPDEYYIADLIGLAVEAEDGQTVGTIIAVDNFGAGDLLEIRPAAGKPFYVPFRKEYLVALDLPARQMTLSIPDEFRQD